MSRLDVALKWAEGYQTPNERASTMAHLYMEEGLTMQEIGEQYGISRQRVDQILKRFGLVAHYGRSKKEKRAQALREAHARVIAGESTSAQEAEALGLSLKGFRSAVWNLGLYLRRPLEPAEHGTYLCYHRGCHCDECRRANREYQYAWRQARGVQEHGIASSYINYGCRCPACREAVRIQTRAARARRRQALTTD